MSLTRRQCLAGLALPLLAGAARADETPKSPPARIAAFEWGSIETLLALGVTPVAAADIANYDKWVIEPAMPPGVIEVGLRTEPNLELLRTLGLDLILVTPQYEVVRPILARIAPTWSLNILLPDVRPPLRRAQEETQRLARLLQREAAADELIARVDAALAEGRERLTGLKNRRPLYLVNFLDGRHVRVYGQGSLFQAVLDRLGLSNAWRAATGPSGFATIGIDQLATNTDARLIYFEPLPKDVDRILATSPLWTNLPFVAKGHVGSIAPVWSFGGLPSVERLARLLTDVLTRGEGR